jgi:PIN domain nuclease of toxin-antitoxin system
MLLSALHAMDEAAYSRRLFVSHISLWDAGVANQKKNAARRPDLNGQTIPEWFKHSLSKFHLRALSLTPRIALEAAEVPAIYGSGDPGDCFLIATARIRNLALVTRDRNIQRLVAASPHYLSIIPC